MKISGIGSWITWKRRRNFEDILNDSILGTVVSQWKMCLTLLGQSLPPKDGIMLDDIGGSFYLSQKIFQNTILNYPIHYMAMIKYW